ncbi:MAG: AraC family transcriptional regulator [Cellvibrionaceae bacterium]
MKDTTTENYRKRFIKVIEYIYGHLDGSLDVNTLADVACMSPYHFHRIYRQMSGETINASIRRLRLQGAAAELIRSSDNVESIAKQSGYGSLEAFSRAFRKEFGESPRDYRVNRVTRAEQAPIETVFVGMLSHSNMQRNTQMETFTVEVHDFDGQALVGVEHQGDYMGIGESFEKLFMFAGSQGMVNEKTRSFGLYYDDPKTVPVNDLRAIAGLTGSLMKPAEGFQNTEIPKGKCASVLFKGSYAELEKPYDYLFGQWLPESGYEPADFPAFEEYLNDPKTTPPNELLTRIHCLLA